MSHEHSNIFNDHEKKLFRLTHSTNDRSIQKFCRGEMGNFLGCIEGTVPDASCNVHNYPIIRHKGEEHTKVFPNIA